MQHVLMTMRGDSVIVVAGTNRTGIVTTVGALPLLTNSFAFTELFTRRARALGDSVDLPGWSLNGGMTLTVSVRPIGTDSLRLTMGGQEHRLRVDATGHVLGGTIPDQQLTILRVDGAAAATIAFGKPPTKGRAIHRSRRHPQGTGRHHPRRHPHPTDEHDRTGIGRAHHHRERAAGSR